MTPILVPAIVVLVVALVLFAVGIGLVPTVFDRRMFGWLLSGFLIVNGT